MNDGAEQSDYSKAIEFLYGLQLFGARLGLENTAKLAARAGNPHQSLRFIHVAGTNGKGSTCAMLESIYRRAGYRVGLFTSPHLISFRERIQVNRELIAPKAVVRWVQTLRPLLEAFESADHPTFFEIVTVLALCHFADQRCELVIWETGLGGRLDATNIVTPLASVITNIQADHQQWLGNTLASIAAEKGGIIKPSVPVITGQLESEPRDVIRQIADRQGAPLHEATDSSLSLDIPLGLPGQYQRDNAALATAVVDVLQMTLPVSDEALKDGLRDVRWPGRFQVLTLESGRKVILDGAHNPAGAQAFAESLREMQLSPSPALILGVLQDKDWRSICHQLAPLARKIYLVPVSSNRTAIPAQLTAACEDANPNADVVECRSLAEALDRSAKDPFVVISGSLYLIGEALQSLAPEPPPGPDERGLNAWTPTVSRH